MGDEVVSRIFLGGKSLIEPEEEDLEDPYTERKKIRNKRYDGRLI